jgi:prepilin-type N-terminal cleavage/methylation domain-containing protein
MKLKLSVKGFTLVELLITIGIVGILGMGVVVAIDPAEKINAANVAKGETFSASIQNNLGFDLIGEWTFNDGTAKDISGYGNDGVVSGATLTTDRKGQSNKAFSFNGTTSYIDVGDVLTYLTSISPFSVEAWIKTTGTNYGAIVSSQMSGGTGKGIQLGLNNLTNNNLLFRIQGVARLQVIGTGRVNTGKWVHVAATYDGSRTAAGMRIYVNGTQGQTVNSNLDPDDMTTTSPTYIGVRNQTELPFPGIIDDVRIYKATLLSSQIRQLYAQELIKRTFTTTQF